MYSALPPVQQNLVMIVAAHLEETGTLCMITPDGEPAVRVTAMEYASTLCREERQQFNYLLREAGPRVAQPEARTVPEGAVPEDAENGFFVEEDAGNLHIHAPAAQMVHIHVPAAQMAEVEEILHQVLGTQAEAQQAEAQQAEVQMLHEARAHLHQLSEEALQANPEASVAEMLQAVQGSIHTPLEQELMQAALQEMVVAEVPAEVPADEDEGCELDCGATEDVHTFCPSVTSGDAMPCLKAMCSRCAFKCMKVRRTRRRYAWVFKCPFCNRVGDWKDMKGMMDKHTEGSCIMKLETGGEVIVAQFGETTEFHERGKCAYRYQHV